MAFRFLIFCHKIPLVLAVEKDLSSIAQALIDNGADINVKDQAHDFLL